MGPAARILGAFLSPQNRRFCATWRLRGLLSLSFIFVALVLPRVVAATFIWDGGHAGQDSWTANQNWNPNGAPANNGTADLVFTGNIRLTPNANSNSGWSINSLTFDAFAGAFTINGDALTIQGSAVTYAIANNSSYAATITNAITLGSAQSWNANTANLTFSGTVALGANSLTLAGNANTTLSGAIGGSGSLVKTGSGTLILSGANTYTGTTTVSAGTLQGSTTSLIGNIVNNGAVVFDQAASGSYGGIISGSGSFTKQNAGTLTLTNANTFTGPAAINGGTVVLGAANALASTIDVSLASGATLQLSAAAQTVGSISGAGNVILGANTLTTGGSNTSTTLSGAISGTGGVVKTGSGTLTLSGTNTYTGATTVNSGTVQGTSTSLPGNVTLSTAATAVVFDQATAGTYAGVVSGSGSFTKQNTGTLTLTGANTYTGATAITGGTLALGGANALADTTAVTVSSGAALQLNASNETIGSLAGAGNVNLGSYTLTSGGTNASTTFSGVISGTGAMVKNGSGTLTLSGSNSYSGGTSVNGGTLQGTTTSLQGNIALANSSIVTFDQTTSGTYSGAISGTGSVTKSNTGTVTLSGANTYTGSTTISGGTLALGVNNALPAATNLTLTAGTTLDLAGNSAQIGLLNYNTSIVDFGAAVVANTLLFTGGGTGSGTLTINNFDAAADKLGFASSSTLLTGYLEGVYFYGIGAGIAGATNQTIAGYSGTWNLIVPNTAAFRTWDGGASGGSAQNWSSKNNWDGNNTLVGGTTLRVEMAGTTQTTNTVDINYTLNTLRFAAGAGTGAFTINAASGAALTFGGSVPSIIQLATNAQTINAPLVFNSTTVIETTGAGTLTLGGVISGASGGINKVGVNTLILAGANTYDGTTTINAGTVIAQNSSALGSTAGGTAVSSGAILQLENNISVGAEALTLDGSLRNASGANSYGGAISGSGTVTVNGGSLSLGGSAANTYTGATTVNTGTLYLNKSGGATAIAGNLVIGNGTGTATTQLMASNQIADTAAVTLNSAATPVFNLNGFSDTIGSLASSNSAAAVQLGAGTLTTGDSTSTTFAGVVSGTGNLIKQGAGTFTLSGANTYSGTTTVNAGTLVVQNSAALGTTAGGTTVAGGATLQLENNVTIGAEALTLNGALRNASGTNSYAGTIGGTGSVTVDGGSLSLGGTAANTYTDATAVNSGTLYLAKSSGVAVGGNLAIGNGTGTATVQLMGSNQISNTAAVTLNGAGTPVLNINGYSQTIGSLASTNTAAAVQLGAGTLTTGDSTSTTFAGVISGTGSVVKQGTGTFTLSGANTYTGTTTVNAGKLSLAASNALSASSNLTLAADTTFSLNGTSSQKLNLLSFTNATVDFGTTGTANYLLLSNIGSTSGLLTISNWTNGSDIFGLATNTVSQSFLDSVYFAGINVGVGAVISSTTTSVPGYGNFYTLTPIPTFTWSGAQSTGNAADLDNWSKSNNWVGGIAPGIAAVKSLIMAGGVQTTNDMDGAYQIKGLLFRSDAGAFTINSSTGDSLTIGGAGIINQSANTQTLNVSIALSAAQTWTADSGAIVAGGVTILNAGNTLTIAGAFNTTINASIDSGAGGLIKNGTGTLTLGGTNAFTGGLTINAGTVSVASSSNLGASTVTFNGGTLSTSAGITATHSVTLNAGGGTFNTNGFNSTLSGVISGTGALTKSGAGTLTLSGANTYSGGTTVSAGALQGTTTSLQGNVVNNASLVFDQTTTGTYAGAISGSGSLTKQNTGTVILTGANTYSGGTTVSGGTLQGDATSLQGNFAVTSSGATVAFNQTTNATYAGVVSGPGTLTKLGAATLTLTGSNTIASVGVSAGTLRLGASNTLSSTAAVTVSSGATFDVNGFTQTIGALAGPGTVTLGAGTLTVGNGNVSSTFGGNITGTGVLDKIGSGALTFSSSFSFAGELKLTGGTVNITGINLNVGTLRISGNTVLDFGNSVASFLTTTNLIIENGAILTINNWVDLQDYFYVTGAFYGYNTTTFATTPAGFDIRGVAPQNQIVFTGYAGGGSTTVWLPYDHQITPAPEPAVYGAAMMAASLGLLVYRRSRRRNTGEPAPVA